MTKRVTRVGTGELGGAERVAKRYAGKGSREGRWNTEKVTAKRLKERKKAIGSNLDCSLIHSKIRRERRRRVADATGCDSKRIRSLSEKKDSTRRRDHSSKVSLRVALDTDLKKWALWREEIARWIESWLADLEERRGIF